MKKIIVGRTNKKNFAKHQTKRVPSAVKKNV
jgi:hypothetical protein